MKEQEYLDLQNKHRKEVEDFPIAYAFNDEQLKEALKKLGVESTKECVTIFGHGDIVKKENAKPFIEMLKRHTKEVQDRMKTDPEFAEAAFLYEMDNHEYAINLDGDGDVLSCFGMDYEDLREAGLQLVYETARRKHFEHMEDWGVI